MKKYSTLFFDLDHTLWDFEKNSHETLSEIYEKFKLRHLGVSSFNSFYHTYQQINNSMWDKYRKNEITKDFLRSGRFLKTLENFHLFRPTLAEEIGNYYIKISPFKINLFPQCHEVLKELQKKYNLHIITNGFDEVQHIKLRECQLTQYFKNIITSEVAGYKKPEIGIFDYAIKSTGAKKETALMIGDGAETDIIGAKEYGIDQVYFNSKNDLQQVDSTYTITHLAELLELL